MIRKLDNIGVLFGFGLFLAALISFPLWTLYQQVLNANVLFLMTAAEHMLAGERMSESYYDTNPPLSVILYVPSALLVKYTTLNLSQAVYLYCISALGLGLFLFVQALKTISNISFEQKAILFTVFLFVHTIIALFYWGEREYFISLTLIPFIFTQIYMTQKTVKISAIQHVILAFGAFFIMIKPHYYIIPALILIHRFITQKRLSIAWDRDALYLCGFALSYALILCIFFNDYLTVIFPDVLSLYVAVRVDWITNVTLSFIGVGMIAILVTLSTLKEKEERAFILLMFVFFIIATIPYYLQGKGFLNHLIIPFNFFLFGFNLFLFYNIRQILEELVHHKKVMCTLLAFFSTILILGYILYHMVVFANQQITHREYQRFEIVKMLKEQSCEATTCAFFMFNDSMEITHQLALYSGLPHASRFPSYWFLPVLIKKEQNDLTEQEKTLIQKYAKMVTEDFETYKPHILFIGKFKTVSTGKPFDFRAFFSSVSPEFFQAFKHYKYDQTIVINQADYLIDHGFEDKMVEYDVYLRQ